VTVLCTSGDEPHAIPVSTALRAGPDRILIALADSRESLRRLRADSNVAITIQATGVSCTALGTAAALDEPFVEGMTAVEIVVARVQYHGRPTFALEGGVSWRWTDEAARARDAEVRSALSRLAAKRA
jgi:hypothetical protein